MKMLQFSLVHYHLKVFRSMSQMRNSTGSPISISHVSLGKRAKEHCDCSVHLVGVSSSRTRRRVTRKCKIQLYVFKWNNVEWLNWNWKQCTLQPSQGKCLYRETSQKVEWCCSPPGSPWCLRGRWTCSCPTSQSTHSTAMSWYFDEPSIWIWLWVNSDNP